MIFLSSPSLPPSLSCVFEYNDPDDYFDVSNHEVDRQEDLEYEVRTLLLDHQQPIVINKKKMSGKFHSITQLVVSLSPIFKYLTLVMSFKT